MRVVRELEDVVVTRAAMCAGEAAGDPLDKRVLVDGKLHHAVDLAMMGLRGSARAGAPGPLSGDSRRRSGRPLGNATSSSEISVETMSSDTSAPRP